MTYIVNTAEADLEIPQFSEEDYSTRQEIVRLIWYAI